jgi:hypothetical protein
VSDSSVDSCHMATECTDQLRPVEVHPKLSDEELFEQARQFCAFQRKSFEGLIYKLGPAVVRCREIADARKGNKKDKIFEGVLLEVGIDVGKHDASRILRIMKEPDAVIKWQGTLTKKEKTSWVSPSTICQRCPVFKKLPDPNKPKKVSPYQKLQERIAELQEENNELKRRIEDGGDSVDVAKDKPEDIAHVWFGQFGVYKGGKDRLKRAASLVLEMLEKDKAMAPRSKATDKALKNAERDINAALARL